MQNTTRCTPREGDFHLRDFVYRTGEVSPILVQHWTTLGEPRRDAAGRVENAVLVLHGTTGRGTDLIAPRFSEALFGPGQPLDTERYYLIFPDSIGHGGSSKPSDGLRARFPRYDYQDMVTAQHRLVVDGLEVDHLRAIVGISMGGMHAVLWGLTFPDFVDAIFTLACLPSELAGRNRMWRKSAIDAIRRDPEWQGGDYTKQPFGMITAARLLMLAACGAVDLEDRGSTREKADQLLEEMSSMWTARDANDFLYQLDASRTYAPTGLENLRATYFAANPSDDYINPIEVGLLDRTMRRIPRGKAIHLPPDRRGHASALDPSLWSTHLAALLDEAPGLDPVDDFKVAAGTSAGSRPSAAASP